MITNNNDSCANVLIDTCIWSLVLRHRQPVLENPLIQEFGRLAQQERVVMLGASRQELLSGIREPQRFEWLRQQLRTFSDFPVDTEDYERAAKFFNSCRAKGIQGSNYVRSHNVISLLFSRQLKTWGIFGNIWNFRYTRCRRWPTIRANQVRSRWATGFSRPTLLD